MTVRRRNDDIHPALLSRDTELTEMAQLWPSLSMDEKRYVVGRPLFTTDAQTARHIGRDKNWLIVAKRRPAFKQAIKIRGHVADDEVGRLLDEDLTTLLKMDIAGWVQGGR